MPDPTACQNTSSCQPPMNNISRRSSSGRSSVQRLREVRLHWYQNCNGQQEIPCNIPSCEWYDMVSSYIVVHKNLKSLLHTISTERERLRSALEMDSDLNLSSSAVVILRQNLHEVRVFRRILTGRWLVHTCILANSFLNNLLLEGFATKCWSEVEAEQNPCRFLGSVLSWHQTNTCLPHSLSK